MSEGYYAAEADGAPFSGLDEYLCEYVDGTMDPVVRAVFEEYLRANPDLLDHVECLRRTKMMLCHYGCRRRAPQGVQARLRRRLGCEIMRSQAPLFAPVSARLGLFAAFASTMVIMMVVGLVVGEVFFAGPPAALAEGDGRVRQAPAASQSLPQGQTGTVLWERSYDYAPAHLSALGGTPALFALRPRAAAPSDSHAAAVPADRWQRISSRVP